MNYILMLAFHCAGVSDILKPQGSRHVATRAFLEPYLGNISLAVSRKQMVHYYRIALLSRVRFPHLTRVSTRDRYRATAKYAPVACAPCTRQV